ncbi:MAG: DNA-binding transcriptional regulator GbsR (MarR family) [Verrucomicrobiales bacterium]|jgi:DNA-binding transcriptional regulator GbsR (MarR family)
MPTASDESRKIADTGPATRSSEPVISEVETKIVDFFVQLTKLLAIPKSVGEIYGILFASQKPLSVAEITTKLGISKATASYALRFLGNINAIAVSKEFGNRSDLFTAETSVRKLAFGFLSERVEPFIEERNGDLETLNEMSEELPESDADAVEEKDFLMARVKMLTGWQRNARQLMPLVQGFSEFSS